MAKASPAALHTARPTSIRSSTRASVGSSSSTPRRDVSSKGVAKRLAYDDNFTFPDVLAAPDDNFTFPDAIAAPDDDLAPLLELPDPADSSSSTLVSAAPDIAVTASADSAPTEVAAPAEATAMVEEEEPLPDQLNLALAELHGGRGLSPRSKRLVAEVLELLASELNPTATTLRLRHTAFWGKVRVWILAATVATMAAIDVALAVALISRRRGNYYYYDDVLPPT